METNAPEGQANAPTPKGSAPAYALLTSPGLWDIIRLENAKVDLEVIKAYIKNSNVPYNPSTGEIITLKAQGVPPDIIAALLQRGGELRAQAGQGNPATAVPPAYAGVGPGSSMAPPYDYTTDYGAYPADYAYGYPYGYPYWWGYSSYWPGYAYWPWWGFGFNNFGPHRFHDFDRFHHPEHFNRSGLARFQNDDFNRFSRARFQNFDFNSQAALNARSLSPAPAAFGSFRNAPGAFAPRGSFAPAAFANGAFGARSPMAGPRAGGVRSTGLAGGGGGVPGGGRGHR